MNNEIRQFTLMRAMAAGTTFCNGGMGIGPPRRRVLMTLKTEARLLFNENNGPRAGMWLTRRAVTNQAISFGNRHMDIFLSTNSCVTLSGQTSIRRLWPGSKHKAFTCLFDSKARPCQST